MLLIKYTKFTAQQFSHPLIYYSWIATNSYRLVICPPCAHRFYSFKYQHITHFRIQQSANHKTSVLFQDGQVITTDVVTQHRKTDPLTVSFYYQQNRSKKKNLATFCYEAHNHLSCGSLAMERQTLALTHTLREITQRVTSIYNQPSGNPTNFTQFQ